MNHVIFFSGGLGSWKTARVVASREGTEKLYCLFTDTLIEDNDLYRFLLEALADLYRLERPADLIERAERLTPVYKDMDQRKAELEQLRVDANNYFPGLIWLSDGLDPWDIYEKSRYLGSSRIAKCSHVLKQDMAARHIKENFAPDDTLLYMGIDWTEEHRTSSPRKNWQPYKVLFPLCEEPLIFKDEILWELEEAGIELPALYKQGFSHNNCGGFCCRAGQGHFMHLLEQKPDLYAYHEKREKDFQQFIGKDYTILKRTVNKKTERFSLEQLRRLYEEGKGAEIDRQDVGGCGCFVQE